MLKDYSNRSVDYSFRTEEVKKDDMIKSAEGRNDKENEVKGFNYSFNPKVDNQMITALVPYKNRILEYLESLIPNTPESEISKEVIYKIHYKQVRKIINKGGYNFENQRKIDLDKISKKKQKNPYYFTGFNDKAYQSQTVMSKPLGLGHNVENYLLYKNLKSK